MDENNLNELNNGTSSDSYIGKDENISDIIAEESTDSETNSEPELVVDPARETPRSDLEQKIEKIEKELESQKDLYLRLAAEYDNYRKRTERDRLLIYGDAVTNTLASILPIADSLDAAVKSFSDAPPEYKKGLSLLVNQLNTSFKNLGIESFGAEGDVFNPQDYEAISHIDDASLAENTVVEVLRKGYKLKGKIVRCAMVKVAN